LAGLPRKQELERREREIAQREQEIVQRQQQQVRSRKPEFSSQDLWQAAQDFKARAKEALQASDFDAFNENNALAEQAEQHARQFYQVEQREAQQAQLDSYTKVWNGHMNEAIKDNPDAIKADAPLAKAIHSLLETHGQVFWMIPDGFKRVVEVAKMQIEAGSASELRDKLTKAEKEVARLTKATTPLGGGPTEPIQPKKLDDLPIDEQMKELERMAAQADRETFANA
jgi:flagellin-specific chaperone FliS